MQELLLTGKIADREPYFWACLNGHYLVLAEQGNFQMTVDTGFSSGIALPQEIIEQLDLEPAAETTFTLATGEKVTLPIYLGQAKVKHILIDTWFVPGDYLSGMDFLSTAGNALFFDFLDKTVTLLEQKL